MKIIELDEVDSTNDYCKRNDSGSDMIVCALRQTAGRGTKGRSFISQAGGLYISCLKHYSSFKAADAFKIMIDCTVAVCKTVQSLGLKPTVRWANDVLVGGKKICGTLIENSLSNGVIVRSVVGIGLNINNQLPAELKDIATTVYDETHVRYKVEDVGRLLVKNLQNSYTAEDYRAYIDYFGREVVLVTQGASRTVTALGVTDRGLLAVREKSGEINYISSAEVSLRI